MRTRTHAWAPKNSWGGTSNTNSDEHSVTLRIFEMTAGVGEARRPRQMNALWKTDARVSELLSIRKTDLNPHNKTLQIATLKTGLQRWIHAGVGRKSHGKKNSRVSERILVVPDDLVVILMSWAHSAGESKSGLFFDFTRWTVGRIVRDACSRAGIGDERAPPHTFRHSYAVHLLMNGVPVTVLKDLFGHSSIASTLVYLRITQPDVRSMLSRAPR